MCRPALSRHSLVQCIGAQFVCSVSILGCRPTQLCVVFWSTLACRLQYRNKCTHCFFERLLVSSIWIHTTPLSSSCSSSLVCAACILVGSTSSCKHLWNACEPRTHSHESFLLRRTDPSCFSNSHIAFPQCRFITNAPMLWQTLRNPASGLAADMFGHIRRLIHYSSFVCGMDTLPIPHSPSHSVFVCILEVSIDSRSLPVWNGLQSRLQSAIIYVLSPCVFPSPESLIV